MSVVKAFKPQKSKAYSFWEGLGIAESDALVGNSVREGFTTYAYDQILARTKLSRTKFQQFTHIPVSTIKRRLEKQERFSTQESDVMYRLALLTKLASDMFDDEDAALAWMEQATYGLGGKRPLDMIATTVEFEQVRDLIGRIEHGVFS
ncbi:DUF2384 domain-containing protein [Marinomonas rhizomae]|uniref:Putative toxin-antitoxin system antitoxin component (TIGR02293 family) n=1 Tax=Marinomonas rhizomae TaxID=491948 RepID=A0A366IT83_9GAMM|nr:antitoxin Xre/MbcA/ParS toxin-binding domain-containing protein [Marinomonas rhizomae]RBP77973.1 putative toxin-antitoxin system antitoxin component (TIGR02293 family) [Marinomonas rhizomae]RNF68996.1 DUF2384 domain-containing protein [Marinomonas rhizomae]